FEHALADLVGKALRHLAEALRSSEPGGVHDPLASRTKNALGDTGTANGHRLSASIGFRPAYDEEHLIVARGLCENRARTHEPAQRQAEHPGHAQAHTATTTRLSLISDRPSHGS